MSNRVIDGLKLIRHTGSVDKPDDPSYPYKLYVNCSPPEFMDMAFIFAYGTSEEVIVRSKTREALDEFVEVNNFKSHPRLRYLEITGPDGTGERFTKEKKALQS